MGAHRKNKASDNHGLRGFPEQLEEEEAAKDGEEGADNDPHASYLAKVLDVELFGVEQLPAWRTWLAAAWIRHEALVGDGLEEEWVPAAGLCIGQSVPPSVC